LMTIPDDAPPITSSITALEITYAALAAGTTTVNCVAEALDGNGNLLTGVAINVTTIEILGDGAINGIVTLERTTDYTGIDVRILDISGAVAATTTTDATGTFSVTLPPGYYTVEADTAGYVGATTFSEIVVVLGSSIDVGTVELLAGDVNGDAAVDLLDVTQFAADYNQPSTNAVDFDRNAATDLRDFAALVTNIDVVGPLDWGGEP
jgi:hypothetical protein